MTEKGIDPAPFAWLIALYVALIGLSMVSNVLYNSGKEINLKGKITFVKMIVIVLVVAFLATDPDLYLWLIFLAYTVSGPIQWLLRGRKRQAD
jgi:CDP-diacylglycerol--serine O-phosphatidyltransferase